MTTLQKSGFGHLEQQKHLFEPYKLKNVSLKHRQYSSSKLIKTLVFNETNTQPFFDKNACTDAMEGALEKKELKKYCINKFKVGKDQQQKHLVKRKNTSLKILKREESQKHHEISKTEEIKSNQVIPLRKEERTSTSLGREFQSLQTITVKRRFQLLRLNKNSKLKLQIKDENLDKNINKGDVSFQQTLQMQKNYQQDEKILSSQGIRSQNVLGQGLRKCSSNKIKVLVKNPFERHIRQQQALQEQLNQINTSTLADFKESQIISKLDDSVPSIEQYQQLSELIAMI